MMFTGAVKNLFGCIPGLDKAQYHLKVPDRDDFGSMLVDLMLACKPALAIMDAVVGMEGEGPAGGTPRQVGALHRVRRQRRARRGGLGDGGARSDGGLLEQGGRPSGTRPLLGRRDRGARRRLAHARARAVRASGEGPLGDDAAVARQAPARLDDGPAGARTTVGVHQVQALRAELPRRRDRRGCDGPAFDHATCIRCYCCQELCPPQVIGLKVPPWRGCMARGRRI